MRKGQIVFSGFFILIIVLSIWFWLSLKAVNDFYNPSLYIKAISILVINLSLIFVLIYLFDNFWVFLSLIILPISYLTIFGASNIYLISSSLISLLFLWLAFWRAVNRKSELIKADFLSVINQSKSLIGLSISILIAGLIYFHILSLDRFFLPKSLFEKAITGINPFVNKFSDIDFNSSVDNLLISKLISSGEVKFDFSEISAVTKKELNKLGLKSGNLDLSLIRNNKEFQDRLTFELSEVIKKKYPIILSKERQNLSDKFKLPKLTGKESVYDLIFLAANNYFISQAEAHREYLPLIGAISFLFIGQGVFGIFSLLALIVAKLVLKLFKIFGIIKIEKVSTEREVIVI